MIAIRTLTPADAKEFWTLRLQALKDEPESFGRSYEESVDRPLPEVEKQLEASDNSFVLGAFNGALIGTAGIFRHDGTKVRHKATVWGVYVAPEGRGKGVARELMQELIERCRSIEGIDSLVLSVVTSKEPAYNLYRSLKFEQYGLERCALRIGQRVLDEYLMELQLSL